MGQVATANAPLKKRYRHTEYRCWDGMKQRCLNPKSPDFEHYGGRGITICQRWVDSFEEFLEDIGPRPSMNHSVDRIDNNGNYEPGNCRWATKVEQKRNMRTNRLLTFGGTTMTMQEWAETIGINKQTLHMRLSYGWSVERALTQPKRKRR